MGKKNNYDNYSNDPMYNQTRNEHIADCLEYFVSEMNSLFIRVGRNSDDIKKAEKTIKKACKSLRNGRPEKVFDEERFDRYIESDDYSEGGW